MHPVAGDSTRFLMYRLTHGEIPVKKIPKLAMLLVGMNDFTNVYAANPNATNDVLGQQLMAEVDPTAKRCVDLWGSLGMWRGCKIHLGC